MFSGIEIGDDINDNELNLILKNLYKTDYFRDVKILLKNNILNITVDEYPIIQSINYTGIKSKSLLENIIDENIIKEKSPYNDLLLKKEKNRTINKIK